MRLLPDRRSIRYALAGGGAALALIALMAATVSGFPSRPTFQTVRAIAVGTNAAPNIEVASSQPVVIFNDSNNAADEKIWRFLTGAANLQFATMDDARTVSNTWLTASRAGNTTSNIQLGPVGALAQTLDISSSRTAFSGTSPRIIFNDTDAAANEKLTECIASGNIFQCATRTDADAAGSIFLTMTRSGTAVSTLNLQGTEVQVNGLPISGTNAQGTFTASFDTACTTTPTVTYDWTRSGNIVVLYPVATAGFPCTGDSTSFVTTGAPVPAAIRPNTNADLSPHPGYTDNSVSTWAQATVTSGGNISYNKCTALNTTCNGAGWTAALNRSAPTFTTVTYMLGNP